jgi:hypothetical protein
MNGKLDSRKSLNRQHTNNGQACPEQHSTFELINNSYGQKRRMKWRTKKRTKTPDNPLVTV